MAPRAAEVLPFKTHEVVNGPSRMVPESAVAAEETEEECQERWVGLGWPGLGEGGEEKF